MKKLKILTSFVGLTTLASATAGLATSCTNGELKNIIVSINSKQKASGTQFQESDITVRAIYANNKQEVIKYDITGNNGYVMADGDDLIKIGHNFIDDEIDQTKNFKIVYRSKVQTGSIKVVKGSQPGPVVGDTFKVEFDVNGGDFLQAQTVKKGEYATKVTPTKKNCAFVNWFTDKECTEGKEYIFETTPVTANIVLYAKWKPAIIQNGIEFNVLSEEDATCEVKWDFVTTLPEEFEIPSTYIDEATNKVYTVTKIAKNAFSYNGDGNLDIESIAIPSTIKTIGYEAFRSCLCLKHVVFSEGLEVIEDGAFCNCPLSGELKLPNSLIDIGSVTYNTYGFDGTFYDTKISKVVIPPQIKVIPRNCFSYCENLKEVEFNNVEKISYKSFSHCALEGKVNLPDSVTSIESIAFEQCSGLKEINIPAKVTDLESSDQFYNCQNLEKVSFDDSNNWYKSNGETCSFSDPSAAASWFKSNNGISVYKNVEIPYLNFNITKDDVCNVSWNSAAETPDSIVIPASYNLNGSHFEVSELYYDEANNKGAFEDCTAQSITLPDSMIKISKNAFKGSSIKNFEINSKNYLIGANAFTGSQLEKASFKDKSYKWQINDDSKTIVDSKISEVELANKLKGATGSYEWSLCPTTDKLKFDITSATTEPNEIKISGFDENKASGMLVIPEEVTINDVTYKVVGINDSALSRISCTLVVLPKTIRTIGKNAFYYSKDITNIIIPKDSELTSIEYRAFSYTSSLKEIFIPKNAQFVQQSYTFIGSGLQRIIFDEDIQITTFEKNFFAGLSGSLMFFNVPKLVTNIKTYYLFAYDQPSKLSKIRFDDCSHKWKNIMSPIKEFQPSDTDYAWNRNQIAFHDASYNDELKRQ